MDKNLVVSLDEIKGIRLQCKECESEVVVSPANSSLLVHGFTCPQGHPWQELGRQEGTHWPVQLDALRLLLIESEAVQGRSIGGRRPSRGTGRRSEQRLAKLDYRAERVKNSAELHALGLFLCGSDTGQTAGENWPLLP